MTGTFAPHHRRAHVQARTLPGDLLAWCEISRSGRRVEWYVDDLADPDPLRQPIAFGSDRIPWPWTPEQRSEALEKRMRVLEWEYQRKEALTA